MSAFQRLNIPLSEKESKALALLAAKRTPEGQKPMSAAKFVKGLVLKELEVKK